MKRSSYMQKLLKNLKGEKEGQKKDSNSSSKQTFSTNLNDNEKAIRELLGYSQDVQFTKFKIQLNKEKHLEAMVVAIDGLVDEEAKRNNILKPLLEPSYEDNESEDLQTIQSRLSVKQADMEENIEKALKQLLKAQALLVIEGISQGLLISIEGFEIRAIDEPE